MAHADDATIEADRGRAVSGARPLAAYIFNDEEKWRSVYALPREEFGLIELAGRLTGFTGWIDRALAARAKAGKRRKRRTTERQQQQQDQAAE
jgi:hypothetical protein